MKRWIYIIICLQLLSGELFAQQTDRFGRVVPQVVRKSEQVKPVESLYQEKRQPDLADEYIWKRILYREIDLSVKENGPVYYPVRPIHGRQNLFAVIFHSILDGTVPAYQYIDGYELYEDKYCLPISNLLDEWGIYYEIDETEPGTRRFIVEKEEYPVASVTHYYLKERWYIHPVHSILMKEIEAICPLITELRGNETFRTPLFWIKYNDISPVLQQHKVMTSDLNNSWLYSMDDFFTLGLYKAPVVKTENLMNKTLRELYPDPDSLRIAQEEIEKQLESFKKSLSWSPDSTKADKKQPKKERTIAPVNSPKPIQVQPQTSPTRSVRRR